jgi:hypothetical protein
LRKTLEKNVEGFLKPTSKPGAGSPCQQWAIPFLTQPWEMWSLGWQWAQTTYKLSTTLAGLRNITELEHKFEFTQFNLLSDEVPGSHNQPGEEIHLDHWESHV